MFNMIKNLFKRTYYLEFERRKKNSVVTSGKTFRVINVLIYESLVDHVMAHLVEIENEHKDENIYLRFIQKV